MLQFVFHRIGNPAHVKDYGLLVKQLFTGSKIMYFLHLIVKIVVEIHVCW
jgi:hypothetical protein